MTSSHNRPSSKRNVKLESGRRAAGMVGAIMIAKIVSFVMLAAAFLVVVRILGPSVYGIYTVAIAVAGFFGAIGGLGVSTAITKFLPEHLARKNRPGVEKTLSDSFALLLVIGAILTVAAFLVSGALASDMSNPAYAPVIALASLVVVLTILFGAGTNALIGLGSGSQYAWATVAMTMVQSSLAIALALMGFGAYAPLEALIAAYAIGFVVCLFFIYAKRRLRFARPTLGGMRKIFSFSWPLGLSGVLNSMVTNLVPILLGTVATAFVLGNFGVVSKVSYLMDIVIGSVSLAILPSFAGSFARGESKRQVGGYYSYSVHLSFVLLAPVFIAVVMLAVPVAITAFSGTYTLAPTYVAIFSFGLLLSIFGVYAPQLLISAGKVKEIIKYTVIEIAIQLALMPLLILPFGGIGAIVLLYLITPLLTDILFMYAVWKDFGISLWSGKLTRASVANAIMAAILVPDMLLLGNSFISIIAAAALVFVAYPPILYMVGGINRRDVELLNDMTGRIPGIGALVRGLTAYATYFSR